MRMIIRILSTWGTVTKLVPIVIINSPPKGYAEGKASFTAVFSYNIRNNFIDLQKVSSNTLIFNVRAKDGGLREPLLR